MIGCQGTMQVQVFLDAEDGGVWERQEGLQR